MRYNSAMANYTVRKSKHATAAAATVDTVTLTLPGEVIEIINRSGDYLWAKVDDSNVVAGADDTEVVPPGSSLIVKATPDTTAISVLITAGGAYSVVVR